MTTYNNETTVVPGGGFPAPYQNLNLVCTWSNARGRCTQEVDFIITFGAPPCGHAFVEPPIQRFCARHMMRAMFTMLTEQSCNSCSFSFKGISLLRVAERL